MNIRKEQYSKMNNVGIRRKAREALVSKWKVVITTFFFYSIVINLPQVLFEQIGLTFLSMLFAVFVGGGFMIGVARYFLNVAKCEPVNKSELFYGFTAGKMYWKNVALFIYRGLFVFLWSLLLIVPGIIAAIRYSQAFYILAENPEKGIRECMNESKDMMRGYKGQYFCLALSFIGWGILSIIPVVICTVVMCICLFWSMITVALLMCLITCIFTAPISVYINSSLAVFYMQLKN